MYPGLQWWFVDILKHYLELLNSDRLSKQVKNLWIVGDDNFNQGTFSVNSRLTSNCFDASMIICEGLYRRTILDTRYGEDIEVYVGGGFWIEWPGLPYSWSL